MKIAVAGMGYVGLSLAVLLSRHNEVYAHDISAEKVDLVRRRKSPVGDTQIQQYLSECELNLHPTLCAESAYRDADYVIVATPDAASVETVTAQAAKIAPNATVAIKSTVPASLVRRLTEAAGHKNILLSPEFLREGLALRDNLYPSRIVVGISENNGSLRGRAEKFAELLKDGALSENIPVLITGLDEAEAIKLFSNAYLAMRVAYFNELDAFAETKGLNVAEIITGVGLDPRIGSHYNNPSFGYGGGCLPKDTRFLLEHYKGIPNSIIGAIVEANQTRKDYIAQRILARNPKVVGVYRLLMKSGSDNFRECGAGDIIGRIAGTEVIVYEPLLDRENYMGCPVVRDLSEFKALADLIISNRYDKELDDVIGKVYTRDLFYRD